MSIAAIPFLSRLYGPADFGRLAVYLGIFAIALPIVSLRFEAAIPVAQSEPDARQLFRLSMRLLPFMAMAAAVTGTEVRALRERSSADAGLLHFGVLLLVGLCVAGVYQIAAARALRVGAFRAIAGTKFSQNVAMAGVQAGFGFVGGTSLGLVFGQIVGQGVGALRLLRGSRRPMLETEQVRSSLRAVARRYKQFALLSAPSSMLNSAAIVLPQVLLAERVGVEAAGAFFLCQRMLGTPVDLLNRSLGQVHLRSMARFRRRPRWLLIQLKATVMRLGVPSLAILAAGIAGPLYVERLLGPSWAMAGTMLAILAPANATKALTSPITSTLLALEENRTLLILDATRLTLIVSVFVLGPSGSPLLLTGLISGVMTVTYGMYSVAVWLAVTRRSPGGGRAGTRDG